MTMICLTMLSPESRCDTDLFHGALSAEDLDTGMMDDVLVLVDCGWLCLGSIETISLCTIIFVTA